MSTIININRTLRSVQSDNGLHKFFTLTAKQKNYDLLNKLKLRRLENSLRVDNTVVGDRITLKVYLEDDFLESVSYSGVSKEECLCTINFNPNHSWLVLNDFITSFFFGSSEERAIKETNITNKFNLTTHELNMVPDFINEDPKFIGESTFSKNSYSAYQNKVKKYAAIAKKLECPLYVLSFSLTSVTTNLEIVESTLTSMLIQTCHVISLCIRKKLIELSLSLKNERGDNYDVQDIFMRFRDRLPMTTTDAEELMISQESLSRHKLMVPLSREELIEEEKKRSKRAMIELDDSKVGWDELLSIKEKEYASKLIPNNEACVKKLSKEPVFCCRTVKTRTNDEHRNNFVSMNSINRVFPAYTSELVWTCSELILKNWENFRHADYDAVFDTSQDNQEHDKFTFDRERKRNHCRITLRPDEEMKRFLLSKGLSSSDTRREYQDEREEDRLKSKRWFSYSTDTYRIDDFIENFRGLEKINLDTTVEYEFDEVIKTLAQDDPDNHMRWLHRYDEVNDMSKTTLGCMMLTRTIICTELVASLKQIGEPYQFRLKYVAPLGIYLLCRPHPKSQGIHYSCIIPKSKINSTSGIITHDLFADWEYNDTFYCSTLCFASLSLLDQGVTTFEKFIGITLHQKELMVSKMNQLDIQDLNKTLTEFCNFLGLIMINHRPGMIDNLSLFRYLIMKSAQRTLYGMNVLVNKLCDKPRDLLTVWIAQRYGMWINETRRNPPKLKAIKTKQGVKVELSGLVDYINFNKISFEVAINLSYLTHSNSIAKGDKFHRLSRVIMKIYEGQKSFGKSRMSHRGSSFPVFEDLERFEYHGGLVRSLSEHLVSKLQKDYGEKWKEEVSDKISFELKEKVMSEFGTLKKSAVDVRHVEYSPERKDRATSLENSLKLLKELGNGKTGPLDLLDHVVEVLQKRGLVAAVFDKEQITGAREIFILDIESRIAQFVMESISRVLSESVQEEMLKKVDKLERIIEHSKRVSESRARINKADALMGKVSQVREFTTTTSGDMSKWSECFLMKMLGEFMTGVLDGTGFSEFMCIFFNAITNKSFMIPSLILSKREDFMASKNLEGVIAEFYKEMREKTGCFSDNTATSDLYMKVKTGFMQGIVHWTSSLFHATYMSWMLEGIKDDLMKTSPHLIRDVVTTGCVSSDDCTWVITVIYDECLPDDLKKLRDHTELAHNVILRGSRLLGLRPSIEKSALCCNSYFCEFNSLWFYNGSVITPNIKFINACTVMPQNARTEKRIQGIFSARNELARNSCPIIVINYCQLMQLHQHYRLMGMGMSTKFITFFRKLRQYKLPELGYLALTSTLFDGLESYEQMLWKICKEPRARDLREKIQGSNGSVLDDNGISSAPCQIMFNIESRHNEFKSVINPLINSYIIRQPRIMFDYIESYDKDDEEGLIKLRLKPAGITALYEKTDDDLINISNFCNISSANLYDTFQRTDSLTTFALSVYILETKIGTFASKDKNGKIIHKRCSMLEMFNEIDQEYLGARKINLHFPFSVMYDDMELLNKDKWYEISNIPPSNNRMAKIRYEDVGSIANDACLESLCRVWDGTCDELDTIRAKEFTSKSNVFKMSLSETRDTKLFDSDMRLMSYMKSLKDNDKTISFRGRVESNNSSISLLQSYVSYNTRRNKVLVRGKAAMHEPVKDNTQVDTLISLITSMVKAVLSMPIKDKFMTMDETKMSYLLWASMALKKHYIDIGEERAWNNMLSSVGSLNGNVVTCVSLCELFNTEANRLDQKKDILQRIIDLPDTIPIWYTKKQSLNRGKYTGFGEFCCYWRGSVIRFSIKDREVFKIEVEQNSLLKIQSNKRSFFGMIRMCLKKSKCLISERNKKSYLTSYDLVVDKYGRETTADYHIIDVVEKIANEFNVTQVFHTTSDAYGNIIVSVELASGHKAELRRMRLDHNSSYAFFLRRKWTKANNFGLTEFRKMWICDEMITPRQLNSLLSNEEHFDEDSKSYILKIMINRLRKRAAQNKLFYRLHKSQLVDQADISTSSLKSESDSVEEYMNADIDPNEELELDMDEIERDLNVNEEYDMYVVLEDVESELVIDITDADKFRYVSDRSKEEIGHYETKIFDNVLSRSESLRTLMVSEGNRISKLEFSTTSSFIVSGLNFHSVIEGHTDKMIEMLWIKIFQLLKTETWPRYEMESELHDTIDDIDDDNFH